MLTSTDITKILTVPGGHDVTMRLRGRYNRLLSDSFLESPFQVVFTPHAISSESHSHFTVTADTDGTFPYKPVFILFVLPKSTSSQAALKEAEDMLKELLKKADTPFTTMHGACVSASRIAFYSYDRKLEVFTPESRLQGQFFDFDLTEDAGAVRMLQVVEEVKSMCRELLGELKILRFRAEHST